MKYRLLATAGHVDHGKTELLKALTGQETDRLDEEQQRGLTIDLGFADMKRDNLQLGFVDVPGHHNFIKNMVSGIGSVQGVVFVVSAADGWEEQSREHFEIVRLVDPDYCCFALTKIDLVDEEMQLLAQAEIEDAISGTDFEDADIVPVSSTEPTGIDEFRTMLFDDLEERSDPSDFGKPYCPVDRVFTVKGQGTVLTGSLSGGVVQNEAQLVRMPANETGRVRSIQQYHESVESAHPGSRVALNVPDWSHDDIQRGNVVTVAEAGSITNRIDGLLETPDSLAGRVDHDRQGLAYLGTDRETIQLLIENERRVEAGGTALARLHWPETEVFARPGDRIILRDFSDRRLLGCVTVLSTGPDGSLHDDEYQSWLRGRHPVRPKNLLSSELERVGLLELSRVSDGTPYDEDSIRDAADELETVDVFDEDWLVESDWLAKERDWIRTRVENYHERYPLRPGLPLHQLNERYGSTRTRDTVLRALDEETLTVEDEHIKLTAFSPEPGPDEREAIDDLLESLNDSGLETPDRDDIVDRYSEELVNYLIREEKLVQLDEERLVTAEVYRDLVDTVESYLEENQPAALKDLRDVLDSSRKYVIPLMEYLDQQGVTIREGDVRRLRTDDPVSQSGSTKTNE